MIFDLLHARPAAPVALGLTAVIQWRDATADEWMALISEPFVLSR